MMDCKIAAEILPLYIDGELDAEQRLELEKHMDECEACGREYGELMKVTALLRAIPRASVPASFDERLRASINGEKSRKLSVLRRNRRKISGLAAVFVIGIFSAAMYNYMGGMADIAGVNESAMYAADSGVTGDTGSAAPAAGSADSTAGADVQPKTGGAGDDEIAYKSEDLTASEEPIREQAEAANAPAADMPDGEGIPSPDVNMSLRDEGIGESEAASDMPAAGIPQPQRHLYNTTTDAAIKHEALQSTRDRMTVELYLGLIKEELKELDYAVTDFRMDENGNWNFTVEINTTDELNMPVIERYTYTGQDGKLWKKELSSLTETVY